MKKRIGMALVALMVGGVFMAQAQESTLDTTVVESAPAPAPVAVSPAPAVPVPTVEQRPAAPTPPVVVAEQSPQATNPVKPETPVTVATKTPKFDPPSAEIITTEELQTFQYNSLNDALRRVPGTTLVQNGGAGSLTGFSIRGLNSDHNLISINGRRLPPGLAGQYQLEFIDLAGLQSAQLLKGSASSVYGADAIGGVLDLNTTDARYVETDGVSVFTEGGTFNTWKSGGSATLRQGRLGVAVDGFRSETDGHRPNSRFENETIRANVALDIADGVWFDVFGYYQSGEAGVAGDEREPFANFGVFFPGSEINSNDSRLISPRLTIEKEDWNASALYSYNENRLDAVNNGFDNRLDQEARETEVVWNYTGLDNAVMTLGGGSYTYSFDRSPLSPSTFTAEAFENTQSSIFGQVDWDLFSNVNFIGSIRGDAHDEFAGATTHSVALTNTIPEIGVQLHAKHSTGYHVPTGQDILFTIGNTSPADLKPEESESWEIGFRHSLLDEKLNWGVTYFSSRFSNSIDSVFDFATFSSNLSLVDGEAKGFEVDGYFQATDQLGFYTNYTYLDTLVTGGAGSAGVPGDRLNRRPRHTLNAGVVLDNDDWDLGLELHGAFDRFDRNSPTSLIEDYAAVRLFGSYDLTDSVQIYGRLENMFDEKYVYTPGFSAEPFAAYGGVRVTFGK